MKGLFANRSPLLHFIIFMFFVLFGMIFSSALQLIIFITSGNNPANILQMPFATIQTAQFLSSVFSIFMPALCTAYFCSANPEDFLYIKKADKLQIFLFALLMTFFLSPTIELTEYFNSKMQLPESMSAIEQWMKKSEDYAKEVTIKMLSEKGISAFFVNIIVIAVTAAISEEFLYRGAFLSIVKRMIKNQHLAIWIVAIIFSAIHLQFYGFIPRMLSGAYLGYLLYWSKSIWIPIFAHFCNNATAIIVTYYDSLKGKDVFFEKIKPEQITTTSVLAVIGLILFAFSAKKFKKICQ